MRSIYLAVALLVAVAAQAAPAWHHPLYLGNGGLWRQRVAVTIANNTDREVAGEPVTVAVGPGAGQANLVGAVAEAVRVCNAAGVEMLYAVADPAGNLLKRGPIPAGSTLTLPVEAAPRATTTYFVYFDNPDAWLVPDFWRALGGLRNGGMETGEGDEPDAWNHDAGDAQHQASWVTESPRSGKKCLKTVVAPGAPNTWIATRQRDLRIVGGARYVMTAWVKAQDVKGNAGWYIHVGNEQNSMLISPMLNGGSGTYDWKQVRAEFTAPAEANLADLGTVLWGTGTAWFDDVELTCLDESRASLTATASPAERLPLTDVGADAPWHRGSGTKPPSYLCRVPVRVTNLSSEPQQGLVSVSTAGLSARLGNRADFSRAVVVDGTRPVTTFQLQDTLLFQGQVPPQTRKTFYLYLPSGQGRAGTAATAAPAKYAPNPAIPEAYRETRALTGGRDYGALLASPDNLVKNPSFEAGGKTPDDWPGTAEGSLPPGTVLGFDSPGLFGQRSARMSIPATAKPAWTGWRQSVPVQPGHSYLFAAWLKCQDLVGGLQLHVHLLTEAGELVKSGAFSGAGPAISGTTDWTLLSGVFADLTP